MTITRRSFSRSALGLACAAGVAPMWRATNAQAVPRVRKNIDTLPAQELDCYLHAMKIMMDRSRTNPGVRNSYAYFAAMHNTPNLFRGACVHGNHLFIPWHRAHLYYFEQQLRATDPSHPTLSTKDVTIPYWDWSQKPSGSRYPKTFEDTNSILFDETRNADPAEPMFPWSGLREDVLVLGYSAFAGQPVFGSGSVESPAHNDMHSVYVGGPMANPRTASNDPIYWSFHCFIDALWWYRQKVGKADQITGLELAFVAMNDEPDGAKKVSEVVSTDNSLGYTYDFDPPAAQPAAVAGVASPVVRKYPGVADRSLKPARLVQTFDWAVTTAADGSGRLQLAGIRVSCRLSYSAYVYAYPRSVEFRPADPAFRNAYLVHYFSVWIANSELPDCSSGMFTNNDVTITRQQLERIIATGNNDRNIKISVAINESPLPAHVTEEITTTGVPDPSRIRALLEKEAGVTQVR